MTNITPILDPKTFTDKTTLTEHQIGQLDLSRLPRKVRILVHRPNGIVQIKHVGKKLDVRLLFDFVLPFEAPAQELSDLGDDILREAARMLNEEWQNHLPHVSAGNREIRIVHYEKATGSAVLAALDRVVDRLVDRGNELVATLAKGLRLGPPEDDSWV